MTAERDEADDDGNVVKGVMWLFVIDVALALIAYAIWRTVRG